MADRESDHEWERRATAFLREPIPESVHERAVLTVADVLAATVAGAGATTNGEVAAAVDVPAGDASVLGTDRRVDPASAALLNATASISQEIEEGHNTGGHVGAGIVTGGFALAERYDADGATFVDACVKAYELCVRIERGIFAVKDRLNDAVPWLIRDPHSTWTTVGPAVAGALCMDLPDDRVAEAFRVAANLAVVSMHDPYREGAPARNYTAGFSAQAGVTAALVAAAGLDGSRSAMEAVYGPLHDLNPETFGRSFEELGEVWEIEHNYFKPVPSCRYTHPPLGALREVADDVDPATVESVDVYTFRNGVDLDYTDYGPFTSAKFSTPYVLARAMTSDDLWLEAFEAAATDDPDVRALAERVRLHHDADYEATFPEHWSARVEVTHRDGRTVVGECIDPSGDFRAFPGADALAEKFERLFASRLGERRASEAVAAALDLRNRDVRAVAAALRTE